MAATPASSRRMGELQAHSYMDAFDLACTVARGSDSGTPKVVRPKSAHAAAATIGKIPGHSVSGHLASMIHCDAFPRHWLK